MIKVVERVEGLVGRTRDWLAVGVDLEGRRVDGRDYHQRARHLDLDSATLGEIPKGL